MKKSLLHIAANKKDYFFKSLLAATVLSVICLVISVVIQKNILNAGLIIVWGSWFILAVAIYVTIACKITSFENKKNRTVLLHYPNYRSEIYRHPVWGKVPSTKIYFPGNWKDVVKNSQKKSFHFSLEVLIEMSNLNNGDIKTIALIPITWTFQFKYFFSIVDLEKIAKNGGGSFMSKIDIEDYLKNAFLSLNEKDNIKNKIRESVLLWHEQKITPIHLKKLIENVLILPEKLFSNTSEEKINIGLAKERAKITIVNPITSNTGME